jgi:hypothetical protein
VKHDWRGGSAIRFCGNAGCSWIQLPRGVDGDPRVHYMKDRGERAILKPHPCEGKPAAEEVK